MTSLIFSSFSNLSFELHSHISAIWWTFSQGYLTYPSNLMLYQNLNSSSSLLTQPWHFLIAPIFSFTWIRIIVVLDCIHHTYTIIHHHISTVPLWCHLCPTLLRYTTTATTAIILIIMVNMDRLFVMTRY